MLKFVFLFLVFIANGKQGSSQLIETLEVIPQEVSAKVGDKLKFVCTVRHSMMLLMTHPLKWERQSRDGSVEVISTLTNVEPGLQGEYKVQIGTDEQSDGITYTLELLQGMKKKYDGFYKCVLYIGNNDVFLQDQVEVKVKEKMPSFKPSPTNVTVKIGDTAKLLCAVEDMKPTAISWFRGEDFLYIFKIKHLTTYYNMDQRTHIEKAKNKWNLVISNVNINNAGYYECTVKTEETYYARRFRLHVDGRLEDDRLSVIPHTVSAKIGDTPEFTCDIKKDTYFLITNPVKWEKHSHDGSVEVISTLGYVEPGLEDEYSVVVLAENDGVTLTLKLIQGMQKNDDEFFKCVMYDAQGNKVTQDEVAVLFH